MTKEELEKAFAWVRAAVRMRDALENWARVARAFRSGSGSARAADTADEDLLAFVESLPKATNSEEVKP